VGEAEGVPTRTTDDRGRRTEEPTHPPPTSVVHVLIRGHGAGAPLPTLRSYEAAATCTGLRQSSSIGGLPASNVAASHPNVFAGSPPPVMPARTLPFA